MKKLEMIIKPEKLDDVKKILDDSKANGVVQQQIRVRRGCDRLGIAVERKVCR